MKYITLMGLLGGLCLLGLSYPPFSIGLWPQSELIVIGLYGFAAVTALGLLGSYRTQPELIRKALFHPLVLFPLFIAFISFVFSLQTDFPLRSWFGSPELGQGILWFLSLSIFICAGLVLKRDRRSSLIIMGTAVSMVTLTALLTLMGDKIGAWRPYFFNDYLAFFGIFLFPVVARHKVPKQSSSYHAPGWIASLPPTLRASGDKRSQRQIPHFKIVVYIAISLLLYLSDNRSAQLLIPLIPIIYGVTYFLSQRFHAIRPFLSAMAFMTPCLIVGSIILGLFSAQSLWSRAQLFQTAFEGMKQASFTQQVMGQGWGSFTDLAVSYIPFDQAKTFVAGTTGTDSLFWDALYRADFHPHAEIIEALVSVGFIGATLTLLFPCLFIIYACKKNLPLATTFTASYLVLSSTWFQIPLSMPFFALAISSIVTLRTNPWQRTLPAYAAPSLLASVFVLLAWGSFSNIQFALKGNNDLERGSLRLAVEYHEFTANKSGHSADQFNLFRDRIDRAIQHGTGKRLQVVDLLSRSNFAFDPSISTEQQACLEQWQSALQQFLSHTPSRTDLAVPYLTWRLSRNEEDLALVFVQNLYQTQPFDPVVLWFLGLIQLNDPTTQQRGIANMRFALSKGIQNIIPIEAPVIASVLAKQSSL